MEPEGSHKHTTGPYPEADESMLGFHSSEDVSVVILGCDTMWTCMLIPTFQRNILSPSVFKMELGCFSETYLPTSSHGVTMQNKVNT
jgi:hypothetical protein